MLWLTEWSSPLATASTIHNQTPDRGWSLH
jgi:hypothetical protein